MKILVALLFAIFWAEAQAAVSGNCASVTIVSRDGWNARRSAGYMGSLPNKPVRKAFIHHTVTPHCYTKDQCMRIVRSIQNYHINTKHWSDIGYNYLVGEDGRAYEGRGWDKRGAHTYGYNSVSVAVSVIGNFMKTKPNSAALRAVRNLLDCAVQQGILASNYELLGHRDVSSTHCPGDQLYAEIMRWKK